MNTITRNIYITNSFNYDFSKAKKYFSGSGKFITITSGRINIEKVKNLTISISSAIEDITIDDYLLLSGNIVVCSIVAALVFEKLGVLNLLIWDARKNCYFNRTVNHTDYINIENHPQIK